MDFWDDKARGGDLWQHLRQPKRRSKYRAQAKSAGLGKIPRENARQTALRRGL